MLFLEFLEIEWIKYVLNNSDEFLDSNAKLYLRYIDDIFILWTSTKQQFENFISELNQKHNSIKFDYEISSIEIPFLDTIAYIDNKNHLQTRLYRTTTDRQNYLHRASETSTTVKGLSGHSLLMPQVKAERK